MEFQVAAYDHLLTYLKDLPTILAAKPLEVTTKEFC